VPTRSAACRPADPGQQCRATEVNTGAALSRYRMGSSALSAASKSLQRISTTGSTYFEGTMDVFLS